MQGRDSCRLDLDTSIQEQKCCVYIVLFTGFEDGWFVWLSFCTQVIFRRKTVKKYKKSFIEIFGLVPSLPVMSCSLAFMSNLSCLDVESLKQNPVNGKLRGIRQMPCQLKNAVGWCWSVKKLFWCKTDKYLRSLRIIFVCRGVLVRDFLDYLWSLHTVCEKVKRYLLCKF